MRVSQLRKALQVGGDVLVTRPPGYALLVPRDGLDLWRFERGLDEGERALATDPQRAVDVLAHALSEWRGPPMADIAYAPFAQAAIVRLDELRVSALELRIEADLLLGHHARLVGELQALTREHPLRERLWAQLMTALYRDGRQADALAAYHRARATLIEEIGIEPGPELKSLEARILAQDVDLSAQTEPTVRPARAALAVCIDGTAPAAMASGWAAARRGCRGGCARSRCRGAPAATAGLRAAAPSARVAAFTSDEPGADTVRLAAEQDAAILLLSLPDPPELDAQTAAVLARAASDVALLAGDRPSGRDRCLCRSPVTPTTGRRRSSAPGSAEAPSPCSVCAVGPETGATPAGCSPARRSRCSAVPASARRPFSPAMVPPGCSRPPRGQQRSWWGCRSGG